MVKKKIEMIEKIFVQTQDNGLRGALLEEVISPKEEPVKMEAPRINSALTKGTWANRTLKGIPEELIIHRRGPNDMGSPNQNMSYHFPTGKKGRSIIKRFIKGFIGVPTIGQFAMLAILSGILLFFLKGQPLSIILTVLGVAGVISLAVSPFLDYEIKDEDDPYEVGSIAYFTLGPGSQFWKDSH